MNEKLEYLRTYLQYITNTTLVPLPTAFFDEDWDPIGPKVREELYVLGWITEDENGIRITDKGKEAMK